MKTYYKKTYRGILPAAILACLAGIPISVFLKLEGWFGFAVKAGFYVLIYLTIIYLIGFNKEEKEGFSKLIGRLVKRNQTKV